MSKYGIDFAKSFARPPETMVGECVYDEDGNHVGWVTNTTVDLYRSNETPSTVAVLKGGRRTPEEVMYASNRDEFVHYLPERTCHNVSDEPNDFKCSECGARSFVETDETYTTILSDMRTVLKMFNFCPNCGARIGVGK